MHERASASPWGVHGRVSLHRLLLAVLVIVSHAPSSASLWRHYMPWIMAHMRVFLQGYTNAVKRPLQMRDLFPHLKSKPAA